MQAARLSWPTGSRAACSAGAYPAAANDSTGSNLGGR